MKVNDVMPRPRRFEAVVSIGGDPTVALFDRALLEVYDYVLHRWRRPVAGVM